MNKFQQPEQPHRPEHPEQLISAYIDQTLDDAGFALLCDWLRASESNRRDFARALSLHSGLADWSHDRNGRFLSDDSSAHDAHADGLDIWLGAMAELADDHGEAGPIDITAELARRDAERRAAEALRASRLLGAEDETVPVTSRSRRMLGAWGGLVAALLLLAIILWPASPAPPSTQVQNEPDDAPAATVAEAPAVMPVATLTATHNAQWAEGPLAPGDTLHPNQRLTLTAGFAQITTARGAVAILEAPCTVEMIDSPNAIRLHAGKLVGVCQTASSKGFIVRTPHLDVVDIGTRFGVVADATTRVHTIIGEIEVSIGAESQPVRLFAGHTAGLDPLSQRVVFATEAPGRFVQDWNAIANPPQVTGDIRYEPAIPRDLRLGAEADPHVRLFHERSGVTLEQGIDVNISAPGRYLGEQWTQTQPLGSVTVDSYLVHFDSDDDSDALSQRRVTIGFDRPIIGVIVTSEQLAATHGMVGVPGVKYGNMSDWSTEQGRDGSGLDISIIQAHQDQNDAVQLSEDRRTLTLDLTVLDGMDQLRVLVQSQ